MLKNANVYILIIIFYRIVVIKTSAISYNQPKFSPTANWSSDGITFANASVVGKEPYGIFIKSDNIIYIADNEKNRIHIWMNDSIYPTKTIYGNLSYPLCIFVTINGDIYVDNGFENTRVDQWISDTDTWVTVMYVDSQCYGLFVDINNTLYCSEWDNHKVVKRWLNDDMNTSTTVAGTGNQGFAPNMLCNPHGIFVDTNFDLYVADFCNDRIQLFRSGESNGITVAGEGSTTITIELRDPSGIVLDADKYLFIVDRENNRIIGSDSNGFRCLVGCFASSGSAVNQLYQPFTLSFDSYGNIFVTDSFNHRIQKFILLTNSINLSESTNSMTLSNPTDSMNLSNSTNSNNKCKIIYTNQSFWAYSFLMLIFLRLI